MEYPKTRMASRAGHLAAPGQPPQPGHEVEEPGPEHGRGDHVDPAQVGHRAEQERHGHQRHRVVHDLGRGPLHGGHHRQHRHVGRLVVLLVAHGQRPEVRRRPDEDDGEHHHRRPRQAVGHRGPSDQHRHRAGRAPDHDVLRRAALEPQRVDEDVEERGRDGQHGREQVDGQPQLDERGHLEGQGEDQRRRRRHGPGDQRTVLGPVHQAVDVAVDHHVDGVGPAGGQRAAGQRGRHQPDRRQRRAAPPPWWAAS